MGKPARNEQRKLTAMLMNGVCIVVVGLALTTIAGAQSELPQRLAPLAALLGVAAGLHYGARTVLRRLED